MKNYISLILSLVLLTSCEEEKTSNLKQIEANLKTDNSSTSEFILKNDTVLRGKLGTEIYIPKDLFDNYTNGKITLELKEFYSKEDMILNGLSTITNKDELLESSGMIYINFTEDGKQLTIKNGKKYKAKLPNKILANSNLYTNDNDFVFKWELIEPISKDTVIIDFLKNAAFGITVDKTGDGGFFKDVKTDSVAIIQKRDSLEYLRMLKEYEIRKRESELNFVLVSENDKSKEKSIYYDIIENTSLTKDQKTEKIKQRDNFFSTYAKLYIFTTNKLGWINIDKIVKYDVSKDISISNNDKLKANEYSIFYNYLEKKSIVNHFLTNFKNDYTYNLKIAGKVKVTIYTNSKDKIYYDSFYIDKNSKTSFNIKLKETSLEKLKQELVSQ